MMMQKAMSSLAILGSTGSIGCSTLDVIRENPDKFQVWALAAHSSVDTLLAQIIEFKPAVAVMVDTSSAEQLSIKIKNLNIDVDVVSGKEALDEVASAPEVDMVMAAIVGAAGLSSSLAAVRAGKRLLLANKETLVCAGSLFMGEVARCGATLLPVDSEHNAIFQCLPNGIYDENAGISEILLTGSGGPFRQLPLADFNKITPEAACAHPNWSMGRKISVDSATMMNKGLEFIEACWMFGVAKDHIRVVIHPQSVIHSMVQYVDGSVLAQLGSPDMKTPIAHTMAWPNRVDAGVRSLNFTDLCDLTFEAPDFERFPLLKLAMDVALNGQNDALNMNAANEIAVAAFLEKKISYQDIADVVTATVETLSQPEPLSIDAVIHSDLIAREFATRYINKLN